MKIIYCRKQVQSVVEYVNTYNTQLEKPVTFKEMCEQVKKGFLKPTNPFYKGAFFIYNSEDNENVYCTITVPPESFYKGFDAGVWFEVAVEDEEILQAFEEMLDLYGFDSILDVEVSIPETKKHLH